MKTTFHWLITPVVVKISVDQEADMVILKLT